MERCKQILPLRDQYFLKTSVEDVGKSNGAPGLKFKSNDKNHSCILRIHSTQTEGSPFQLFHYFNVAEIDLQCFN